MEKLSKTYILTYEFVSDYLQKRTAFRLGHFEHIKPYINRKKLLLGGATANPSNRGILIFNGLTEDDIHEFAQKDPYVINGIVERFTIQEWIVVAGSLYSNIL